MVMPYHPDAFLQVPQQPRYCDTVTPAKYEWQYRYVAGANSSFTYESNTTFQECQRVESLQDCSEAAGLPNAPLPSPNTSSAATVAGAVLGSIGGAGKQDTTRSMHPLYSTSQARMMLTAG